MRTSKQLLLDSRPFAREHRLRSWWCLLSTVSLLAAAVAVAAIDWWWWLRIPAGVLAGLTLVRMFIIYHDYMHGTILKGPRLAKALMTAYGLVVLNPPSIWKRSHDHHHKNNAKIFGAAIGSYPVMTVQAWEGATRGQRLAYRAVRHPLTIAAAYLTVFLYGMCIRSLINNPREHRDSAVAIVVHAIAFALFALGGSDDLMIAFVVPCTIASAMGAYLFYAQHNYPGVKLRDRAAWDHVFAARYSSSYMPMNPVMAWFTGNIGYHHVHHLNHKIPFYRLPETMAAFEELQNPGQTSLWPTDVARCLRLALWDRSRDQLITLAQYNADQAQTPLDPQSAA